MGTPPGRRPALLLWLAALLVAAAPLLVFARTVGFDFVEWDDPTNAYENPYFLPPSGANLAHFWRNSYFELYMPVTYTLWGLCARLGMAPDGAPLPRPGGGTLPFSPAPFHALNLAFHVGCALLVFALLWRLSRGFDEGVDGTSGGAAPWRVAACTAGALLFAVHPVQVETVAWVTGANNAVSGLFSLLALHAYLSYAGGRRQASWFVLATLAYAAALLSKPTAATVPLVVAVLEVAVLRRPWRRWAPGLLLWVAMAAMMAFVTRAGSGSSQNVYLPLWGRPLLVGDALAFYLTKIALPYELGIDYGRPPGRVLGSWWGFVNWLAPATVGVLLWRLRARLRWVGVGALLLVAATLPVLGVVPFYLHRTNTVGDRYLYLAMLGPALALAWGLWRLGRRGGSRRTAVALGGGALVLAWAALSFSAAGVWRDSEMMLRHTLYVNPESYSAYNNLGSVYNRIGRPDDAISAFEQALRFAPAADERVAGTHYNLGSSLARKGDYAGGIRHLREAVRLQTRYPQAHNNLGLALRAQGRSQEALAAFREALRQSPEYAPARLNLEETERTLAASPEPNATTQTKDSVAAEDNRRGLAAARAGDLEAARVAFVAAAARKPDYAEAHYNLGLTLDKLGRAGEAIAAYEAAVAAQPDYPEARLNLGTAYARQSRWPDAEKHLAEAARLRPGWPAAEQALALVRQQTGGSAP